MISYNNGTTPYSGPARPPGSSQMSPKSPRGRPVDLGVPPLKV